MKKIKNTVMSRYLAIFFSGSLFLSSFSAFPQVLSEAAKGETIQGPPKIQVTDTSNLADIWNPLTPQQKELAYHLFRAGLFGRDVLFYESHRDALVLKQMIETSLNNQNFEATRLLLGDGLDEFLNYGAAFEDQNGVYSPSNRKFVLKKVNADQVRALLKFVPQVSLQISDEVVRLLVDPSFEPMEAPDSQDGKGLEACGGNMYAKGITGDEVVAAEKNGLRPVENTRVVRVADGKLTLQIMAIDNPDIDPRVRSSLQNTVAELKKALPLSLTDHQHNQISYMIRYLQHGDLEDFRQANIEWVKDGTHSPVDFTMSWTEVYKDFMGRMGSWESYVLIVDPKVTSLAQKLAAKAQYFENKMPYGTFKKTFAADYAPPVVMAYVFQEIGDSHMAGFNLPNFDDIRVKVGAKNVVAVPIPGDDADPNRSILRRKRIQEFAPKDTQEGIFQTYSKARNILVMLHEIIGHGSGTYDESKFEPGEDPTKALGQYGTAMEEQRADLTALVFINDPVMVDVGIYKSQEEADATRKVLYDGYLYEFLIGLAKERNFNELHSKGQQVLINYLLEKKAVAFVDRDGNPNPKPEETVLRVLDYERFQEVSRDLLGLMQSIKATRNVEALDQLFEKYAPSNQAQKDWAQAVIRRGEDLGIDLTFVDEPWKIDQTLQVKTIGSTSLEGAAKAWDSDFCRLSMDF